MVTLLNSNKLRQNFPVNLNYFRRYCNNTGVTRSNTTVTTCQPVPDFYSGKSILITGGTGFCGKVLVEKLLYSCTGLDKIYLLIRDKMGDNVNTRLKNMFANPLFERIKKINPGSLNKVIPIKGDLVLPQLGLDTKDEQMLVNKISVVFHVGASVMFNESLPVSTKTNFEGVQKVLNLCKRIKNIEGLIAFSTAYAHTQRPILSEKIYPAPAKLENVYKFMEEYGNSKEKSKKFIRGRENTYCFAKALAESYIAENHEHVPTCIIRPSIITPMLNEPVKGWLDNWFGATAVLHNIGKGWDRVSLGDENRVADFIPVDHVTNLSIVAAARINGSKEVQVYNSTTSADNPITWTDAYKYIIKESVSNGYNEAPFPFVLHSKSKLFVDLATLSHMIPAHIADIWQRLRGKDPKYAKIVSQAIRLRQSYEYFNRQTWIMEADRTAKLFSKLSPEDQTLFPCNPADIDWPEYMKDYCNGIQRFLNPAFTVRT